MVKAMLTPKVEWLSYPTHSTDGWREVKLAIDGQVASFAVREEDWFLHPTEEGRNAMLVRQATSYLAEFGDFRMQKELPQCSQ
jgi:hypothetical protein